MSYFNSDFNEFMVAILGNDEYPCLPLYELIKDQNIYKEINIFIKKIITDNNNKDNNIKNLNEKIKNLEKENNLLRDILNNCHKK